MASLFALEVLLGTLSLPLVAPALATALIATSVGWLMLPRHPTYDIPQYSVSLSLILWSILLGPLAGLTSALYVRLIAWVDAFEPRTSWGLISAPLLVFAALGLIGIPLPQVLGNGKDVVQLAFTGELSVAVLLLLTALKPLCTAACIGSGAPGGLFTPTVTLMAPTMLAVAGSIFVARLLESRSVYSGRIHEGKRAAARTHEYIPRISSAARYFELMQVLLRMGPEPCRLKVVDERGDLLGEIPPESIRAPHPDRRPLEIATARDFIDSPAADPSHERS
ncbi:MAG TPA: chloride channel protein [Steroidobacteraceae bacterium]|nr:chloride channel protein [Steroidobacteraceae bacterium]